MDLDREYWEFRTHAIDHEPFISHMNKSYLDYFVQLEKGDENGREHLQGWVAPRPESKLKHSSYAKFMREFTKKQGVTTRNATCTKKVHDNVQYLSYIMKNPSKSYVSSKWTNIDEQCYIDELPSYASKSDRSNKVSVKSWTEKVAEQYNDVLVMCDVSNEPVIQYHMIPEVILQTLPKSLDMQVVKRLSLGLANYLEWTHNVKSSEKRVLKQVRDYFKEDNELRNIFCK